MAKPKLDPNTKERRCHRCKQTKPLEEFYPNKSAALGRGYACKPCELKRQRAANAIKPRRATTRQLRERNLKIRFGLTPEQYEVLAAQQNHLCAICGQPETVPLRRGNGIQPLAIDHNHVTGRIRGLLCARCNLALGLLKDDQRILTNALSYLKADEEASKEAA